MRNFEHQIAVAFVNWWGYWSRAKGIDERLLFAIPNGGARNIIVARKLKAEGVRAGVPDYFLAIPNHSYHGLFLELKAGGAGVPKGRVSPEQREMLVHLNTGGYMASIVCGIDEAVRAVEEYLADVAVKVGGTD